MIRSICAKLALPLLLVGAVGCEQPASRKPTPVPPAVAPAAVTTPPAAAPKAPTLPEAAPAAPSSGLQPPAPVTGTADAATTQLPQGAATTSPVIVGEKGEIVVSPPQELGPDLTSAQQFVDTSKVQKPLPTTSDPTKSNAPTGSAVKGL